jgi:hypothetical protein
MDATIDQKSGTLVNAAGKDGKIQFLAECSSRAQSAVVAPRKIPSRTPRIARIAKVFIPEAFWTIILHCDGDLVGKLYPSLEANGVSSTCRSQLPAAQSLTVGKLLSACSILPDFGTRVAPKRDG